ncbi:MAG: sensor histidine kinase [Candidatus Eiseniibacteriota bacterium]
MRTSTRRRSLFWTIAGLLLVTLALGTLLQALVAESVLRPLEMREWHSRGEAVATQLAAELARDGTRLEPAMLDSALIRRRLEFGERAPWILLRADSTVIASAPHGRVGALRPTSSEGLMMLSLPSGDSRRLEVLARKAVARGSAASEELLIVRPVFPQPAPGELAMRITLLFLPIGLLASVAAGLVMLRLLVRRLRGLESLAARVTAGDLSVRVADASGDEIGRLAEQLDHMTASLGAARAQIEATARQRRQLFANITHELATPLTSIRGYAETMLDPGVEVSEVERTRYMRGVLEESRRLDRLIHDLFDLARLEAGAAPLELERLDWVALCRNTIQRFERRFAEAGLRLRWDQRVSEAWVQADGHRLEEVLENLLSNALRYVPDGGSVDLWLDHAAGDAKRFQLGASDDGPGVAPEELEHVFDRFYRGAGARVAGGSRDGGGSGLGLAIVREIIERHGGTVRAERRSPSGLTLLIEIPAREARS